MLKMACPKHAIGLIPQQACLRLSDFSLTWTQMSGTASLTPHCLGCPFTAVFGDPYP